MFKFRNFHAFSLFLNTLKTLKNYKMQWHILIKVHIHTEKKKKKEKSHEEN